MIVKTNSPCNTLDDKMFNFVKSVNVDFSWVNDAIDKLNDEVAKINTKIDSMFPSGVIVKYTNSSEKSEKPFNTQSLIRGWMKDRSKQTTIPSFLNSLGSSWSLIGIYGTFEYDDLVGDTVTFKHKVTFMGNKVEDNVRVCYFTYSNGSPSLSSTGANAMEKEESTDGGVNARTYGSQNCDWEILLSQSNYTIDYIKTAANNDLITTHKVPGFNLWVSGVMEAEWGISMPNGEQNDVEWFTYAPDKLGNNGYTATFVLTVKDITKINPECFGAMDYLEYRKD